MQQNIPTGVQVTIFKVLFYHVGQFNILTYLPKLLIQILPENLDNELQIVVKHLLIQGYMNASTLILVLEQLTMKDKPLKIVIGFIYLLICLD